MDPLSIIAGVGGLVTLAAQTLKLCKAYYGGVRDARESAAALALELEALAANLSRLDSFLRLGPGNKVDFKHTSALATTVSTFERRFTKLHSKLQSVQESKTKRFLWPLSRAEHSEALKEISAFSEWIQFGLSIDSCALLARTSDDVVQLLQNHVSTMTVLQKLEQESSDVKETLKDQAQCFQSLMDSKVRDEILKWISSADPGLKHNTVRLPRVPGTGEWLLRTPTYVEWRGDSSNSNVLWCHGTQGSGKSVLTSIIIDELKASTANTSEVLAFMYLDYRDDRSQTGAHIAASLLKQIVGQLPLIPKTLLQLRRDGKDIEQLLLHDIIELISSCLDSVKKAYLVLDALDECDAEAHRPDVLKTITELGLRTRIRILVTSRSHPADIRSCLEGYPQLVVHAHDSDLRLYLGSGMTKVSAAGLIDDEFAEEVVEKLLQRAQGLFLLASLQLQMIIKEPTAGDMEDAMNRLSKDLPEAFAETISRIQSMAPGRSRLGMDALMWTCYASRKLTIDALADALAIRLGQSAWNQRYRPNPRLILECCQGLLIVEPDTNVVRLAHYSIQEYLKAQRKALFPQRHSIIAQTCLTYLMFEPFASGPCKEKKDLHERFHSFPFLLYAASQCLFHVRLAGDDQQTQLCVWRFLTCHSAMAGAHQIKRYGANYRELYWDYKECLTVTPLHWVAGAGLCSIARRLLDETSYQVNVATKIGTTPLIAAASKGHVEMVELLLSRGANALMCNWYGSALHCAAEAGQCGTIEALIKHGIDPSLCMPWPSDEHHSEDCTLEIEHGRTPLMCTIDHDNSQAAEILLRHGADMNTPKCDGYTFFHSAVLENCTQIVEMLVTRAYVDVNEVFRGSGLNKRTSALEIAASRGDEAMFQTLVQAGADTTVTNALGLTPVQTLALRRQNGRDLRKDGTDEGSSAPSKQEILRSGLGHPKLGNFN